MDEFATADMEQLRKSIVAVDEELVALLNRRAAMSIAVGEIKRKSANAQDRAVFRPGREAELMRHLDSVSGGPLPQAHLHAIYREILSSSRNLQQPQKAAFAGEQGSCAHVSGRQLLGSLTLFCAQDSVEGVFDAVCKQECDIGLVPLEQWPQEKGEGNPLTRYPGLYIRMEALGLRVIGRYPG